MKTMLSIGLDAKYEYGAFGEPLRVGGTAIADDNTFRFSTKYTDTDGARERVDGDAEGVARRAEEAGAPWALMRQSGLVYYGFRYYSPSLGRFLNRDPLGEEGGVNLYANSLNDLVNGSDYLGLCLEGGCGGGGGPPSSGSVPFNNPFYDSGFHNQGGGDPTVWKMQGVDSIAEYLAPHLGEEAARQAAYNAVFLGDYTLLREAMANGNSKNSSPDANRTIDPTGDEKHPLAQKGWEALPELVREKIKSEIIERITALLKEALGSDALREIEFMRRNLPVIIKLAESDQLPSNKLEFIWDAEIEARTSILVIYRGLQGRVADLKVTVSVSLVGTVNVTSGVKNEEPFIRISPSVRGNAMAVISATTLWIIPIHASVVIFDPSLEIPSIDFP